MKELHYFAGMAHGSMLTLHGLGVAYNLRYRNWRDVIIHTLFMIYGLKSMIHHIRETTVEE